MDIVDRAIRAFCEWNLPCWDDDDIDGFVQWYEAALEYQYVTKEAPSRVIWCQDADENWCNAMWHRGKCRLREPRPRRRDQPAPDPLSKLPRLQRDQGPAPDPLSTSWNSASTRSA